MVEAFEFVDGGRTFTCSVEEARPPRTGAWWWFRVSTADAQRYAPFQPAAGDTRDGVQARIAAYYNDLLARRAQPAAPRHWQRGRPSASPPAAPAESATEPQP
jgi:hypothetical protein